MENTPTGEDSSIEAVFLWGDIVDAFKKHAFDCGIQTFNPTPYNTTDEHDRPALAILSTHPDDDDGGVFRLWRQCVGDEDIVVIQSFDNCYEEDCADVETFVVALNAITNSVACWNSDRTTPVDDGRIQDIRTDVLEANWHPYWSQSSAIYQTAL